ncbi:MAG: cytochrome c [Alphaproteobacteria bacterium]|nr:cytochrome c [Alphaproteobacteria bacterium]
MAAIRLTFLAALAIGVATLVWLLLPSKTVVHIPAGLASTNPGMAERGAYVVRAAGCLSCHWDRKGGGEPYAGGVAFPTPFGTFYSPNITPDNATGIGRWNDEEFLRALTEGEGMHGEQLYPALPYTSYAAMRPEDALAIKAHLATLPAVNAPQRPNNVSFPFSWRALMKGWKLLYFAGAAPLRDDPSRDATWNRGRYLVTALGHCAECHTPRNALGAQSSQQPLQGNAKGPGGWKVPALVGPTATEFASWSMEEIASYLKTGTKPDFDSAQGPMAEVIEDNTKHLSDQDRTAIALYLKSLNGR